MQNTDDEQQMIQNSEEYSYQYKMKLQKWLSAK